MNFYVRVSSIGQLFYYTAHVGGLLVAIMFLSINLKFVNVYHDSCDFKIYPKDSFVKELLL